jgi:hypothetical protein
MSLAPDDGIHNGLLEPTAGLEPATPELQVRCATSCAKPACSGRVYGRPETGPYFLVAVGLGVGVGVALNAAPVLSTKLLNAAASATLPV